MVARIKRGMSIAKTLNYNEQKVKRGVARCIHAANYPKDLQLLNFYNKLHRLEHQAAINERVKSHSVHISLNFADADQLDQERLIAIADTYMEQIGFGRQPYLVYEHLDAGHQHIHIVTTNIRSDGSKIDMNNIGRNQSEKARKNIELIYGLVKAEGEKVRQMNKQDPVQPLKIKYGKGGSKQAISNVVEYVMKKYKFTSLGEFNAILKLYNVTADPGEVGSRLRDHRGLLYRILDDRGNKVGVPIKASAFYHKPTLAALEKKYALNEPFRDRHRQHVKVAIDWAFRSGITDLRVLQETLRKEMIEMAVRVTERGATYGVTFVDLRNKCAFNGSDLGKEYSAKGLENRCNAGQISAVRPSDRKNQQNLQDKLLRGNAEINGHSTGGKSLIEMLLQPVPQPDELPYELTEQYKKKKKGTRPSH